MFDLAVTTVFSSAACSYAAIHAVVPEKTRPSLKAVAAETDATDMADSSVVADDTPIVHERLV